MIKWIVQLRTIMLYFLKYLLINSNLFLDSQTYDRFMTYLLCVEEK